tara:strand:- start:794 stop:1093 length:300 start_codon:yes stop_codon:yes gene_type:complete
LLQIEDIAVIYRGVCYNIRVGEETNLQQLENLINFSAMDFKKQVVKHIMSLNLSPLEKQHLISCVALEPWAKGQTSSAYVPDFTVSLEGNYDDYPLGDY